MWREDKEGAVSIYRMTWRKTENIVN